MPATASFEDRISAWEEQFLVPEGARSYPAQRRDEEPDSPVRTPFQRDRDRIVHSKAFRRLKHKTQVFVAPEGDHYRTRLTHTLEACGIARTVARALALNEDLTEAIGLGHDLGHPPFGHAGEEALDAVLRERCDAGFKHNEHSLRVVEVLEREGRGLNLTEQVRDGILNHTGSRKPATLEGRIVKLVDRVAYINHDIDDALRAGILQPEDLPSAEIGLLGKSGSARIDTLVRDIVEHSREAGDIVQSEAVGGAMLRLRKFMFDRVYLGPLARSEHERVHRVMHALFDHYMERPDEVSELEPGASECQRVADYLAGMTDRYCIAKFAELSLPKEASFEPALGRYGGHVALISNESLERVKQAVDIVEVISAHTDLRRQGARWVGLCPFHEERTPSFSVDAQEKLYHCFGCGVGGDTIKFVEEKEGLGFAEAVELLADRYGVELEREREDPQAEAKRQQRRRLGDLLDRTAGFYTAYLWDSEEAAKARAYLGERGLGEEVLRAFGVGYAPSAWDTVLLRGQRAGFNVAELRGVGLAQRGKGGGEYDRFRSRIMFPIRDRRGRTLGFGGRAMRPDQGAKYVNTAETDFFHKSKMLYGIDLAKAAIAKAGRAVVVEGYTDVLALHQAGIEEAIAVMGTAITEEQVASLSGMVDEVVLALDADAAGQEAMLRAQRVAAGRKMRLRVAAMPAGEDPAEMMATESGSERLRALLEGAVELTAFQVGLVLEQTDVASPAERDRALVEVAPILAGLGESASRDDLVRRVAERLDLEPAMVMGRVVAAQPLSGGQAQSARPDRAAAPAVRKPAELTSRERRERALLAMCVALPEEGKEYLARLGEAHLSPMGARAAVWLREHPEDPASNLPREDSELSGLIAELVIIAHDEPASPEAMELNYLLLEQRRLEAEIAKAGEAGDPEHRAALSRERAALVERIARTERVGS